MSTSNNKGIFKRIKLISLFFLIVGSLIVFTTVLILQNTNTETRSRAFSGTALSDGPPLDGTFMQLQIYGIDQIDDYLDEIKRLGMNTVIAMSLGEVDSTQPHPQDPTQKFCKTDQIFSFIYYPNITNKFIRLLQEAQSRNIDVYVGVVRAQSQYGRLSCNAAWDQTYKTQAAAETARKVQEIEANTQITNKTSFKGYWIVEEPHIPYWINNRDVYYGTVGNNGAYSQIDYFIKIAKAIKDNKNATRKLLAASLIDSSVINSRNVRRAIAEFKLVTGIDILLWQDITGQQYNDIGQNPNIPDIDAQYSAVSSLNSSERTIETDNDTYDVGAESVQLTHNDWLGINTPVTVDLNQSNTWSINEIFTCCLQGSVQPGYYRPPSIARVAKQIEKTPRSAVAKRITWTHDHQFSTIIPEERNERSYEAARLAASFKAYYGIEGNLIQPVNYQWITPLESQFPDSGNELFNMIPGYSPVHLGDSDVFNIKQHDSWSGFSGNGELKINLPPNTMVDWIGVQTVQDTLYGTSTDKRNIYHPSKIIVNCTNPSNQTAQIDTLTIPYNNYPDESKRTRQEPHTLIRNEYVFSNLKRWNKACNSLTLQFTNTKGLTFIGEIELVSQAGIPYTDAPSTLLAVGQACNANPKQSPACMNCPNTWQLTDHTSQTGYRCAAVVSDCKDNLASKTPEASCKADLTCGWDPVGGANSSTPTCYRRLQPGEVCFDGNTGPQRCKYCNSEKIPDSTSISGFRCAASFTAQTCHLNTTASTCGQTSGCGWDPAAGPNRTEQWCYRKLQNGEPCMDGSTSRYRCLYCQSGGVKVPDSTSWTGFRCASQQTCIGLNQASCTANASCSWDVSRCVRKLAPSEPCLATGDSVFSCKYCSIANSHIADSSLWSGYKCGGNVTPTVSDGGCVNTFYPSISPQRLANGQIVEAATCGTSGCQSNFRMRISCTNGVLASGCRNQFSTPLPATACPTLAPARNR